MTIRILSFLMGVIVTLIPQHANAINTDNQNKTMNMKNEAKGDPVLEVPIIPDTKEELPAGAPTFLVEAVDYYPSIRILMVINNRRTINLFITV